jgi:hypothetical protein
MPAPARTEPSNLTPPVAPLAPEEIERRRREDEDRKRAEESWQREASDGLELQRRLMDQRAALGRAGPAFEIASYGGLGFSHWMVACLIGDNGKVYLYHPKNEAAVQTAGVVDEREFARAAGLARAIGHQKWQPAPVTADFGNVVWQMSFDGRTTLLQVVGDYVGDHPDSRAGQLVQLIGRWCPYTPEIMSRLDIWQTILGLQLTPFERIGPRY